MYFPGLIIAKVSWNLAATLTLAEWCSAQAWNRDGRCVSCGRWGEPLAMEMSARGPAALGRDLLFGSMVCT